MKVFAGALMVVLSGTMIAACSGSSKKSAPRQTPLTSPPSTDQTTTEPTATEPTVATIRYGDSESQFGRLSVPNADTKGVEPHKVVVLIHGGFWRAAYGLDLMDPLAADLNRRGYATWNIEYRRVGQSGGGYPGTLEDVAAAIDSLADSAQKYSLDLSNVTLIGHSAGGHLAMWAATRDAIPEGQPGSEPRVIPRLGIGLGPVFDLRAGAVEGLGNGAVTDFIGGSVEEFPDRYNIATPSLKSTTPLVAVRGADDNIVPQRFTAPSEQSGSSVSGPGRVRLVNVPGDHFALIDPTSAAWKATVELLG